MHALVLAAYLALGTIGDGGVNPHALIYQCVNVETISSYGIGDAGSSVSYVVTLRQSQASQDAAYQAVTNQGTIQFKISLPASFGPAPTLGGYYYIDLTPAR
jgi:hypothetical protein